MGDLHEAIMSLEPELRLIQEAKYSDHDRSVVVSFATLGFLECRARAAALAASHPTFNWRRVEDEEGDGPFLGWSRSGVDRVHMVRRSDGHWHQCEWDGQIYSHRRMRVEYVCDFHPPEDAP